MIWLILWIALGYDLLSVNFFLIRTVELMQVLGSRNEFLCHVEMQENKFAVQPRSHTYYVDFSSKGSILHICTHIPIHEWMDQSTLLTLNIPTNVKKKRLV